MIPTLKFTFFVLLSGVLTYVSCKKEKSCEGCKDGNKPPIAIAGPDQMITLPTDSVLLDGSSSSDPDGTINAWLWTKISGPASFNILNPTASNCLVKNLGVGTYQFELKVTANGGLSAKDTMQIIVEAVVTTNHPPIANAGADKTIALPANSVTLDGSASTDPDNNITGYSWTKISGPFSFNIAKANAAQTQVTNLVQGVYQFELKVTDAGGLFSKDTMQVIVDALLPRVDSTLIGREFVFQNLIWDLDSLDMGPPGSVIVSINPSDSFSIAAMANMQAEVSIQLDSSSVWINVPQWNWYGNYNPLPPNNGYIWYFITYPYHLSYYFFIENYPQNYQLVGRAVKVKVKFL